MSEKEERRVLIEYSLLCPGGVCRDILNEEEKRLVKDGRTIISGKLGEAEVLNGNKRRYPQKVLSREIQKLDELARNNALCGSLDHEDNDQISFQNASHKFLRLWMEGNEVFGTALVLGTRHGNDLKALLDAEVKVGMSSRGLGSITETPHGSIVGEDLELITFDAVATPSAPEAYVRIMESRYNSRGKQSVDKMMSKTEKLDRLFAEIVK